MLTDFTATDAVQASAVSHAADRDGFPLASTSPLVLPQSILLTAARENVLTRNSIPIASLLMSSQSLLLVLRVNSRCLAVTSMARHRHLTDSSPALLPVGSLLVTLLSVCFLDTLGVRLKQAFLSRPPAWTDFLPDCHMASDTQPHGWSLQPSLKTCYFLGTAR